ncbi:3'-5' exonuclease [Paenibacillus sediminis]|uniref:DNA polymerase III epsilon subunit-like protein n=1 Tax=Paenibacillus sediminis TaxID=664909 RepID=A0ABS4H6I1_9BACL|nr:3'-5' exonuclease [Paenibacillus sediminis]MBP1938150.1 DNA polymerase III epsilon subunit-like protein [Paenibacillus sediminis]
MLAPEIITVIDIETTGLDPHLDHITEIAAIRAEVGADGSVREIGRFQTFVALPDGVNIPPEITELTRISDDDLRGAPDITAASLALEFWLEGSLVISHNAPFDLAFLGTIHPDSFACTRAMSRLVDPDESARLGGLLHALWHRIERTPSRDE